MDSDLVRKYKRLKKKVIQSKYDKRYIKLKSISLISNNIEKTYLILSKQLELMGKKLKKTKRPVIYVINNIEGENLEMISKINNKSFIFSNIFDKNNLLLDKINKNLYYDIYDNKDRVKTKEIGKYLLNNNINVSWVLNDMSDYYFKNTLLNYTKDIIEVMNNTNALIVPVALYKNNEKTIISIGEYVDISNYELKEQTLLLRDLLATQRWQILEKYCNETKKEEINTKIYSIRYSINEYELIKTKKLEATI